MAVTCQGSRPFWANDHRGPGPGPGPGPGAGLVPSGWMAAPGPAGATRVLGAWLARPDAGHLRVAPHMEGKSVHYPGRGMIVSPIPVRHTGENAGFGLTIITARGVGLVARARQVEPSHLELLSSRGRKAPVALPLMNQPFVVARGCPTSLRAASAAMPAAGAHRTRVAATPWLVDQGVGGRVVRRAAAPTP
jgi:hypothetical protein